ncbi:hypothetical protein [Photobacterium leiognathi]|uniref:hypothetical protein n=1 Tax=Photobacterium leiognathi TaxID=553611 RepID=UPI0005AA982B|nr:hypothetical protein [Photobacterium leiognathi]PSW48321.1 hypothetical protein CTM83_20010 [Photobacterium leiognathi subsp. mandapamensis]
MNSSTNEKMIYERKFTSKKWNEISIQIWEINCKKVGTYFEKREVFNFEHLEGRTVTLLAECSSCFNEIKQDVDRYQLEDVEFQAVEVWANLA